MPTFICPTELALKTPPVIAIVARAPEATPMLNEPPVEVTVPPLTLKFALEPFPQEKELISRVPALRL